MKIKHIGVALAGAGLVLGLAFAGVAVAADPVSVNIADPIVASAAAKYLAASSDTVSAAPVVNTFSSLFNDALLSIVTTFIGFGFLELKKYTGIAAAASLQTAIKNGAATEAGVLLASAENNLAGKSFHVGSPEVAAAANAVLSKLPDVMTKLGVKASDVNHIVLGEIGKLQSNQNVSAPTVIAAAPVVAAANPVTPAPAAAS